MTVFSKHQQSGQTIIEVIIAVGLVVLVLTTLVSAIVLGIRNNRIAREQALANDRVREANEWIRTMRNRMGWDGFLALMENDGLSLGSPISYCLNTLPVDATAFDELSNTPCTSNSVITGTIYTRVAAISLISASEIEVTSTVSWTDRGETLSVVSTMTLREML